MIFDKNCLVIEQSLYVSSPENDSSAYAEKCINKIKRIIGVSVKNISNHDSNVDCNIPKFRYLM